MLIKENSLILMMKFINLANLNCIEEHETILEKNGVVWFGKMGNKPRTELLEEMLVDDEGYVMLKNLKKFYMCRFDEYRTNVPEDELFPDYYKSEVLDKGNEFSVWFRLLEIRNIIDKNILSSVIVKSSRMPIMKSANLSMSSFFITTNKLEIIV